MRSISILGCGWLGMPLGNALSSAGYQVKGSTRTQEKLIEIKKNGMYAFQLDLGQPNVLAKDFFEADVIVLNIPPSATKNVDDYFHHLQRFNDEISNTTNVLYISSTGVYPSLNKTVTEVDADENATSRSGISLLKAEQIIQSDQATVVRFGGLINEVRHPGRWFAGKSNISGGHVPVNMIHLDDCIGAIQIIIEKDIWGETFNVCSEEHPLKKDYYPKMSEKLGLEPATFANNADTKWKIVSSQKFLDKTGYAFKRSIWDF